MKIYIIQDREAGNVIESFLNEKEAENTLEKFEQTDKDEGIYVEDFYEIKVEDYDIKDLFNWGELSRLLAGSRQTVRKNKIPLKHQLTISKLTDAMEKVLSQMPPQAAQKGKKENGK